MLKNNIVKISIICCLISALVLGVAIPASAQGTTTTTSTAAATAQTLKTVQGIVTAVSGPSCYATNFYCRHQSSYNCRCQYQILFDPRRCGSILCRQ